MLLIRGFVHPITHQRKIGETVRDGENARLELNVKGFGNADICNGEVSENGTKAFGEGSHGQPGRRFSLCRVAYICKGASKTDEAPYSLDDISGSMYNPTTQKPTVSLRPPAPKALHYDVLET